MPQFILDLANALTPEIMNLGLMVVLVLLLAAVYFVVRAIRQSEAYKQYGQQIDMLADVIANAIITAGFGAVDMKPWEQKAQERLEAGNEWIDPRMLFVLDAADQWIERQSGLDIPMDELLQRAEAIFQTIRHDDSNGLDI